MGHLAVLFNDAHGVVCNHIHNDLADVLSCIEDMIELLKMFHLNALILLKTLYLQVI